MTKPRIQTICLLLFSFSAASAQACDSPQALEALRTIETTKLLQHPLAFSHGWQDGEIRLSVEQGHKNAEGNCTAMMKLEMPQRDLDTVNSHLDQNPAKRILLGAQGYSVPSVPMFEVPFDFTLENGKVMPKNDENRPLNDMHHSLEFMYQLLTQLGAEISASGNNQQPWPEAVRESERRACQSSLAANDTAAACSCRTEALEASYNARQMALIGHLLSHPYSSTSKAIVTFNTLSSDINKRCGLPKR
jgi:hypothetical protein